MIRVFKRKDVAPMSLGSRIYEQRTKHNLSQVDLADLLEVSRQSVSKWETDASVPDLDKLVRMCEVFGVSLDWLVLGKAPDPPPPQAVAVQLPALSRQTVGAALIALGLLAFILMSVAQDMMAGALLAFPFLACGGLFLRVRKKLWLFLGCGWATGLGFWFYFPLSCGLDVISIIAYTEFSLIWFLALLELIWLAALLVLTLSHIKD